MKLAFYSIKNGGTFSTVLEGINNPKLIGTTLVFDEGSITDISEGHILLDDSENPPDLIEDAKPLDKMATLTVEKSQQELDEDKDKRISDLENALLAVLDLLP